MINGQSAAFAATSGDRSSEPPSVITTACVPELVEWIESAQPCDVVGIAPDGGFYVHASLHPFGAQAALDRSRDDGIYVQRHNGELYFPAPWIRAELSSVLKQTMDPPATPREERTAVIRSLEKKLWRLIEGAAEARARNDEAGKKEPEFFF